MSLRVLLASSARHLHGPCRRYATEAARTVLSTKPSIYGQPIFQSHPHLVKPNELTAGIPSEEYERRRRALMDSLPDDSIVVSVAAPIKYMSNNIFYKYRQASDFWYLTGFEEPDSAIILEKNSSSRDYKLTLFCNGTDSDKAKWDGASTSLDDAGALFNADSALPITTFPSHLKALISLSSHVYVDLPASATPRSSRSRPKSILKYLANSLPARREYDSIMETLSGSKRSN